MWFSVDFVSMLFFWMFFEELNLYIMCVLCVGYFVDVMIIIECLYFCKYELYFYLFRVYGF